MSTAIIDATFLFLLLALLLRGDFITFARYGRLVCSTKYNAKTRLSEVSFVFPPSSSFVKVFNPTSNTSGNIPPATKLNLYVHNNKTTQTRGPFTLHVRPFVSCVQCFAIERATVPGSRLVRWFQYVLVHRSAQPRAEFSLPKKHATERKACSQLPNPRGK